MGRTPMRTAASLLAVLATTTTTLAATARADESWHDGAAVTSQLYNPCLEITEAGAIAQAGYLSDPDKTRVGDTFYGRAVFGAATTAGGGGCSDQDQAAELDVALPPGVSLAIDADHPIQCFYADDNGPDQVDPTCPTHTTAGAYGLQFPAGDGGAGWDMPPGRTLQVIFPLKTTRELRGPAGGNCPETLDELTLNQPRDCLVAAIHVADGSDDPWLLPNAQMVIAPGAQPTLRAPRTIALSTLRRKGLTATITANGGSATLTLSDKHGRLARLTRKHLKAGTTKLRLKLSKKARRRLRNARRDKLTLTEKLSSPKRTLKVKLTAKA